MIAAIGGYGMVGHLLDDQPTREIVMDTEEARIIAEAALHEIGPGLALDEDMAAF